MTIDDTTEAPDETRAEPETGAASRRSLLSKGAIAAAVGAAAGVALNQNVRAANGGTMFIGLTNNGTNTTKLQGGSSLWVEDGDSVGGASIYGSATGSANAIAIRGRSDHPDAGVGVRGDVTGTESIGVYGTASGSRSSAVRGRATALGSTAVLGVFQAALATDTGSGVSGRSDAGVGVVASGSTFDLQAAGTGVVQLAAASPAITATSAGTEGSIARNDDGSLWYCYATDAWRRVVTSSSGASFTPVTPFRVYDSRREAAGRFVADENRTISVADARDPNDYSVTAADAVPVGATAVTGNIVAIGTVGTNFLFVNPGGNTTETAASLNWVRGQNIGNAGTFRLNSSREIEVVFGPGTGAHLTFDVTGYYL